MLAQSKSLFNHIEWSYSSSPSFFFSFQFPSCCRRRKCLNIDCATCAWVQYPQNVIHKRLVLVTFMIRHTIPPRCLWLDKRESALAGPPAGWATAIGHQVAGTTSTVNTQKIQCTAGVFPYGSMHDEDPSHTHLFHILVLKFFTNQARDFGVRREKSSPLSFGADVPFGPFLLRKEGALQDDNHGRYPSCRSKTFIEDIHSVGTDRKSFSLETLAPLFFGSTVTGDRKLERIAFVKPLLLHTTTSFKMSRGFLN